MGLKKSILIVDDDHGTCETLFDILESKGFDVTSVKSGEECLEAMAARSYEVVLMDIKMTGMDGLEVLRRIKENKIDSKVIIMTAYAGKDIVGLAKKEGAASVLHKPLDLDKLIKILKD